MLPQRAPTSGACVEVFRADRGWRKGVILERCEHTLTFTVDFGRGHRREIHPIADVWRLEDDGAAQVAGIRVGTRVSIFWPGEGVCFAGRIASHNSAQHLWLVLYDDGDSRVRLGPPWSRTAGGFRGTYSPRRTRRPHTRRSHARCPHGAASAVA